MVKPCLSRVLPGAQTHKCRSVLSKVLRLINTNDGARPLKIVAKNRACAWNSNRPTHLKSAAPQLIVVKVRLGGVAVTPHAGPRRRLDETSMSRHAVTQQQL